MIDDTMLKTLLNLLRYFTPDARVIFQLASRSTPNSDSVMVGELRVALKAAAAQMDELQRGQSCFIHDEEELIE